MMRTLRRWFFASFLVLASCAGGLALLLRHPAGFFAHVCDEGDLVLYSDRSFAAADARVVLAAARAKLRTSPWYRAGRHDAVFVCNAAWRRRLFCFGAPRAGGLNYVPLTANVFLSGARVEENRLVSPTGRVVEDERTLDYFIAHEIAHSLTCERLGAWRYVRLPDWLREGYADYVGRGSVLGRPEAAAAFLREDPEMNWPAAAPYLRYNLMTGFLLEREHRPLETVFAEPEQRLTVEGRLRAWLQRAAHGS
ncbi:MAG TPA: hypothetical protein VK178_02470 [Opitutaceae bacterium]|nr:hypothetical protein [Opitutaceae bacterium]